MVCCRNNLDDMIPVLATLFVGGCVSSIDPKETVDDVKHAFAVVAPRYVFVEEDSVALIEQSAGDVVNPPTIIVIGSSTKYRNMADMETPAENEQTFRPLRKNVDDIAVIVFSSGTTSLPKGIAISHYGMLHGFLALVREIDNCRPDVMVHFASLFWISAVLLTGITLVTGGTKVIAPRISAADLLRVIERYKVSFIFMSNTYTYEITDLKQEVVNRYDTSSLYSIIIGGSTMNPTQLKRIRNTLVHTKVTVGYGSSETAAVSSFDLRDAEAYEKKVLSSGKVLSDVEVKIVDIEKRAVLGPNHQGEILVRSPYLMKGYYNMEKPDAFDDQGFLKTGDIGYFDEDEYLYVTDRIHEVFKYQTSQVSPVAIERVLAEHPAIKEAVVFGVPHEVDRFHPAACIVLKKDSSVDVQEVAEFVSARVSDKNKLRGGVIVIDRIPRTPTGKIQRRSIRDYFLRCRDG
ncbi:luciferin 4-monooxygenase-like isoform X2 [Cylas formicarius]|nr:luciferin 4-monooxygenase-like isoform X2 [Cylas formicarius]